MGRFLVAAALPAMLIATPLAAQVAGPPPVPAAAADEAPPQPPEGAAVGFVPPERDVAGYRTPNRELIEAEAVWHVRVALNVAALGCRAAADEDLTPAYNAMLAAEQAPLAAAVAATRERYRARVATPAWEAQFDDDMTRLYNFFAQPPVHARFCATATVLLHEAQTVSPEAFAAFARAALPRLEAPFTAFYAAYDDYRGALANWRERHAPVVIATAAVPPVGPIAVAFRGPAGPDGE